MPPNQPDDVDADFVCQLCNRTADEVDNDVDDPDEDPHLPPGWLLLTISRTAPNEAYGQTHADREKYIQEELASLPAEMPAEARVHLGGRLRTLLELIPVTETPFRVQTMQLCLCPEHASVLQGRLAAPDWDDLDADDE